jgi:hypothetical protein
MRISLADTMQRDGRASDSRTATLEAFYARVMQRVCAAYREESELPADEAVKLLEKVCNQFNLPPRSPLTSVGPFASTEVEGQAGAVHREP